MPIDSKRLTDDCATAQAARADSDYPHRNTGATAIIEPVMASTQPFEPRHRIIQDNLAVFRPDTESRSRLKIDEQRAIFGTQERDWKTLASYFGWPVTGSTDIRVV
jgi:hypothetical protein